MGGTKSHKIPFWELAKGLINRGHNITFLSGFPADFHVEGLVEITPTNFVQYIQNYTNWDLLGKLVNCSFFHRLLIFSFFNPPTLLKDAVWKTKCPSHFSMFCATLLRFVTKTFQLRQHFGFVVWCLWCDQFLPPSGLWCRPQRSRN